MQTIKAGDQCWDGQNHQNKMTGDEVGRVETHFDDLDDEFSRRLAEDVRSQASVEPDTSPPCSVGFVVFKFSREENRDKNLEDTSLDGDDRNYAQDDVRGVPEFEPPHEFEERNETNNSAKVGGGRHDSAELVRISIQLKIHVKSQLYRFSYYGK
jgi:hypothetical protein